MDKHTPGPWNVMAKKPDQVFIPTGDGGGYIATTGTAENARLIAAAPELLDALDTILDAVDGYVPGTSKAIWAEAYAAVKKARGEA